MKLNDLQGILRNQHGCPFQDTLLWRFNDDGNIDEYYESVHENVIATHGDKEVIRIEAGINPRTNVARIIIQTN